MLHWLFKRNSAEVAPPPLIVARSGTTLEDLLEAASSHQSSGRLQDAEAECRRALQIDAESFEALHLLGVICFQNGNSDEALQLVSRAIALNPKEPVVHCNLGELYRSLGRLEEAIASYGRATALEPGYAQAHFLSGEAARVLGRREDAIAAYRRAIAAEPLMADAYNNLGGLFSDADNIDAAIDAYRGAIAAAPEFAIAYCNLANALKTKGDLDDALAAARGALSLAPQLSKAHCILGAILAEQGNFSEALVSHLRAVGLDPTSAEAHNCLGTSLQATGNTGVAMESFLKAIELNPDNSDAHSNLGMALVELGRNDDSIAALRKSLALNPRNASAHANLLFCLSHDPALSPAAVFAEHQLFGDIFEGPLREHWRAHENERDPDRLLRVGFVSADFRNHAVATFVEPLWAALDRSVVEIWAYSSFATEDERTVRLKALASQWQNVTYHSDSELETRIRSDRIDILIDLSGQTGGNRLLTFARKPAPVQISWIGNPNTTGLRSIDYFMIDRLAAPAGLLDPLFIEKIVRLPWGPLFQPALDAPATGPLPALRNGHLTFGSFNRSDKVSGNVVELWCQVLCALPDSRMLVGGISDKARQDGLAEQFELHGVARERLTFHGRTSVRDYLALHNEVDIILDTFPFNGLTVSCHAIWMGVPVLTLAGASLSSRGGLTINSNLGLAEFTAATNDEFVERAVFWSRHLDELASVRASLRDRIGASPLGQPEVVGRAFEAALRTMWRKWCAGADPAAFEID